LAIAQAGAYLQESGMELVTYLRFYEQQWSELIDSSDLAQAPLQDYPDPSVWTTWAISYQKIRDKHEATANLLLLWSYLDNKDFWYGLFAAACRNSAVVASMLSNWIGDIASSELEFSRAMQLLGSYSLVEKVAETTSYATHPVVYQWAHHSFGSCFVTELSRLAVVTVAYSLSERSTTDFSVLQRRLLPHARACSRQIMKSEPSCWLKFDKKNDGGMDEFEPSKTVLVAIHQLADLYASRSQLCEAEQMYKQALRGKEQVLGPTHVYTLNTVLNLGILYVELRKPGVAEEMYRRALQGYEKAVGPSNTATLHAINNLGNIYADQGKLDKAEQTYEQALRRSEEAFGPTHSSTLQSVHNLGVLYEEQGKLEEPEQMYERALRGKEKAYGLPDRWVLQTFQNLGCLYKSQGKLDQAEQMFKRVLQGHEELTGDQIQWYTPALKTLENMGNLHLKQGEYYKAQAVYTRALEGHYAVSGRSEKRCTHLEKMLEILRDFLSDPEQPEYEESWAIASEACKLQYYGRKQTSAMSIQEVVAASEDSILQRNERKKKKKKEKEKVSIWELVRRVF
jgi:tetratricopeptide (TPR) repeat protein